MLCVHRTNNITMHIYGTLQEASQNSATELLHKFPENNDNSALHILIIILKIDNIQKNVFFSYCRKYLIVLHCYNMLTYISVGALFTSQIVHGSTSGLNEPS